MNKAMLVNRNLSFLLYEWLNVETLCERPRHAKLGRADFDAALMQASRLAAEVLVPINRLLDEQEPRLHEDGIWTPPALKEALDRIHASGNADNKALHTGLSGVIFEPLDNMVDDCLCLHKFLAK